MKKILARQLILKNIHAMAKEFDIEKKKFLQLENSPPPPDNFSNNPSLIKDNPSVQSTVKVLLNKN